jgi:putative transposase
MAHSFTNLLYHIVFATKQREPCLCKDVRTHVYAYMTGVIKKKGGIPFLINGIEDHVHILAKLRPDRPLSQVVCDIKAASSGWIHKEVADLPAFAWQTGYSAFTVSQSQMERVRNYIANQEEHHARMPFVDELRGLLKAHGYEVDEDLMWQ